MSMIIDGTAGATFPDSTLQASANNGMTLLGTISITAVNSVSLGSLTLTGYKSLYCVINNLNNGSASTYISSTNIQSGGSFSPGTNANYGLFWLDLGTGSLSGNVANSNAANSVVVTGLTNVSTSSTTIYFRLTGVATFTAQGSIVIYGVK